VRDPGSFHHCSAPSLLTRTPRSSIVAGKVDLGEKVASGCKWEGQQTRGTYIFENFVCSGLS